MKKTLKKASEPSLPSLSLVFGYIAVKELQSIEDRIAVLARLGYGNAEIALICGSTPGRVAVSKSLLKKNKIRRKNI